MNDDKMGRAVDGLTRRHHVRPPLEIMKQQSLPRAGQASCRAFQAPPPAEATLTAKDDRKGSHFPGNNSQTTVNRLESS